MAKYLVLGGTSGSGKTFIRDVLCQKLPDIFVKVEQCTTRAIRPNEPPDTYHYLTKEEYAEKEDSLIGRCHFNGNFYGSIPLEPDEPRIGIIILAEEAVLDFININIYDCDAAISEFIMIGIRRPLDRLEGMREDRDKAFLEAEDVIYKYMAMVYDNDYENISLESMLRKFMALGEYLFMLEQFNDQLEATLLDYGFKSPTMKNFHLNLILDKDISDADIEDMNV